MQAIKIRGQELLVDIEEELSAYQFDNARWQSDKLIANSPFRDESRPSFFVNLSGEFAGTWADSGAINDDMASGNFAKLIALLDGIPIEDAERYLIDKYGVGQAHKPDEPIRLKKPSLRLNDRFKGLDNPVKQETSPYLIRRGISAQVQDLYGIGYDRQYKGFTAFPIFTTAGELASVFYRRSSFNDKRFFYHRDGLSKNQLLYGIHLAEGYAILNEGFIDALSWETLGYPALAVNGARISREQVEMIKRSPIKTIYLAGDNDETGRRLNRQAYEALRGYVDLYLIDYGNKKDANEALLSPDGIQRLNSVFNTAKRISLLDCPSLASAHQA